jgi:hypothetical protein
VRADKPFLYVLNGEDPVATNDVLVWCDWFEKADRIVDRTQIGDACVLTTFTGRDRAWILEGDERFLWETTIFGGPHHGMGQSAPSELSARVAHTMWRDVALGKNTPDRVKKVMQHSWQIFDDEDDRARVTDESTTWLRHHEVRRLLKTDDQTIAHFASLGVLHPRKFSYTDHFEARRYYGYGPKPKLCTVAFYDVAEVIDVCRRNRDLPRRGYRHAVDLPQHLKPLHAEILDRYVTPGVISLTEFRIRYGYRCKRFGKCYRVRRADETTVCIESSPLQAWKVAYQLEQERLAPILIARDAIAAGRILEAFQIVDQISSDLAVPLRREITRATIPTELAAELEDQ